MLCYAVTQSTLTNGVGALPLPMVYQDENCSWCLQKVLLFFMKKQQRQLFIVISKTSNILLDAVGAKYFLILTFAFKIIQYSNYSFIVGIQC